MNTPPRSSDSDARPSIPTQDIQKIYEKARNYVETTRSLILDRYVNGFNISQKEDKSLVTEADTEAETKLRSLIEKDFPTHGIVGEEFPAKSENAEFVWIIDPIDGTQNFAHGIPTFGTLLAVHFQGKPIVGIIDHPALQQIYTAAFGHGALCNGDRITIADKAEVNLNPIEIVCLACRSSFARSGETHLFDTLLKSHPSIRVYHDCFGHSRAVHGQAAAMVEYNVRLWDLAPAQILVEEAGGKYASLGNWSSEQGTRYLSALFGKRSVVDFLLPLFKRN